MTRDEWFEVAAAIKGLWPNDRATGGDVDVQSVLAAEVPKAAALDAVRALAVEGREFAPTVGQVVQRAAALGAERPEWDTAYSQIVGAIRAHGPDVDAAEASLHPVVAAWAVPMWRQLRMAPVEGENGGAILTVWRREYEAFIGSARAVHLALEAADRRRDALSGPTMGELLAEARERVK